MRAILISRLSVDIENYSQYYNVNISIEKKLC